jgi:hypothetical protein
MTVNLFKDSSCFCGFAVIFGMYICHLYLPLHIQILLYLCVNFYIQISLFGEMTADHFGLREYPIAALTHPNSLQPCFQIKVTC